jgi:protein-tyrosine phosphatase
MDWIDDTIAVGNLLDAEEVVALIRKDVDLIVDARLCFTSPPDIHPIADKIVKCAQLLCVLSEQKAKVLIHCVWGVDRTPFLAMVYYAKKHGIAYAAAYAVIKEKHPGTIFHWDWVKEIE